VKFLHKEIDGASVHLVIGRNNATTMAELQKAVIDARETIVFPQDKSYIVGMVTIVMEADESIKNREFIVEEVTNLMKKVMDEKVEYNYVRPFTPAPKKIELPPS